MSASLPDASPTSRLPGITSLVGTDVGVSNWKLIDQDMVDAFAALTGDDGPIHTDPVEADRVAPYGGTIVQGFMMLSHFTGFAKSLDIPQDGIAFRLNYGFDRVRIISPVPTGSKIRGRFTISSLEDRGPSGALLTFEAKIEVEGSDRPAIVANWLAYLQLEAGEGA